MSLSERNEYVRQRPSFERPLTQQQIEDLRRLHQIWDMREVQLPVLNGQGFVRLVDAFGTDDRVVEAARLTAQSDSKGFDDDRNLLRYLMRHLHTTPVEFGEITIHARVPMDCWRQWVRHRTANINEYSTRYTEAIDAKATTPPDKWRLQSEANRQGSSGGHVQAWPDRPDLLKLGAEYFTVSQDRLHSEPDKFSPGDYLTGRERELHELADVVYQERLAFGVAKEVARKDLPLSTFTEVYWKIDLHNLLHFLALRMDAHAQQEIREYATVIGEQIVAKLFPVTWEAFLDYRFHAMQLTRLDIDVIHRITTMAADAFDTEGALGGFTKPEEVYPYVPPYSGALFMQMQHESWKHLKKCRERVECWAKLAALGLVKLKEGEAPIV
jgi:thymidylate synthase (FAD)